MINDSTVATKDYKQQTLNRWQCIFYKCLCKSSRNKKLNSIRPHVHQIQLNNNNNSLKGAYSARSICKYIINILVVVILLEVRETLSWLVDFNNPIVHTQFGPITGKIDELKTRFNRRPICTFLSIPYARPPVGSNRFLAPLDPDAWQSYDATQKRVMCPQIEQRFLVSTSRLERIVESEDCLYLNVFVPVDRATPVINYPVIVYIHGGEFKFGSKDHYSPEYLLDHGIILVTINYRLGVFGFLSTNDMAAPGNAGLLDQLAALHWVQRNIPSFGGNANDITVMGHDSGAVSASLLLLAPHKSSGLFHKVIAIGGSSLSPVAFQWNPGRQAREFAKELNCKDMRTDKIVSCLRKLSTETLVAVSKRSHDYMKNTFRFWFRPIIDKNSTEALIRDYPRNLYATGEFLRVPLLAGLSSSEGSLEFFLHYHRLKPMSSLERLAFLVEPYLYEFARREIIAAALNYHYVRRLNSSGLALHGGAPPSLMAAQLVPSGSYWHELDMGTDRLGSGNLNLNNFDTYLSPNDFKSRQLTRELEAIGDFLFVAPLIKQLELHSSYVAHTYLFVFDYKGLLSFGHAQLSPYSIELTSGEYGSSGTLNSAQSATGALVSGYTSNFGVAHSDDLFYVLPNDYEFRASRNLPAALNPQSGRGNILNPVNLIDSNSNLPSSNSDNVIRSYVTYLAAFASRIDDLGAAANNLANWLPFRATDRNYMRFSESVPQLFKNYRQTDVSFVNELVEPLEELVNTPLPLFAYEELRDYKLATASLALLLLLFLISFLLLLLAILCANSKRKKRMRSSNLHNTRVACVTREQTQVGVASNTWQCGMDGHQAATAAIAMSQVPPPPLDIKQDKHQLQVSQQQQQQQQ